MATDEQREALREIERRQQARDPDSVSRLAVSVYYAAMLVWLAVLLRAAWVGESYSTMRNGHSMFTVGPALWVQCLGPIFCMAAIFFRLDEASLRFRNRRGWALLCLLFGAIIYIVAPYWFGKVTFLR